MDMEILVGIRKEVRGFTPSRAHSTKQTLFLYKAL